MVKKISDLYLEARKAFMANEDAQTASLMARNLLCHLTGKTQEEILAGRELYASEKTCVDMERAVRRLLDGEPIAYVLGEWDFYGMRLQVTKDVLIPRDDTCAVTALAIKKTLFLQQDPRVLDLCTGSGCIGLAVANRVKDARVTLADVSKEAMSVAKANITKQKLSARVSCVQVDALEDPPAFLGKFDLIALFFIEPPGGVSPSLHFRIPQYFHIHRAIGSGDTDRVASEFFAFVFVNIIQRRTAQLDLDTGQL